METNRLKKRSPEISYMNIKVTPKDLPEKQPVDSFLKERDLIDDDEAQLRS